MPVLRGDMKKAFRVNEVFTVFVAIVTAAGALIGGYKMFVSEARAAGAAEAAEAKRTAQEAKDMVTEVRLDVRALYLHQLNGQRQDRLEAPLPSRDAGR